MKFTPNSPLRKNIPQRFFHFEIIFLTEFYVLVNFGLHWILGHVSHKIYKERSGAGQGNHSSVYVALAPLERWSQKRYSCHNPWGIWKAPSLFLHRHVTICRDLLFLVVPSGWWCLSQVTLNGCPQHNNYSWDWQRMGWLKPRNEITFILFTP